MNTVRYRGREGFYEIQLDGERVGHVFAGFDSWTAVLMPLTGERRLRSAPANWAWTAPTRRQAVQQLLAHLGGAL